MNEDALPLEEYQAFMARQRAATAPESHSNNELRPCPFCGQQHKVERGQELHWGMGWFIDCHQRTIMQAFNEADRAKMIEHWNTRPIEDELRAEWTRKAIDIQQLHDLLQDPAAVELNLKAGRIAMPQGLHWDGDNETTLRAENAQLQARIEELEAMLRSVEWLECDGQYYCEWCGAGKDHGHNDGCKWRRLLGLTQEDAQRISEDFRGHLNESMMNLYAAFVSAGAREDT